MLTQPILFIEFATLRHGVGLSSAASPGASLLLLHPDLVYRGGLALMR